MLRQSYGFIVRRMSDSIRNPDFRQMTPDELRRGITTLNFLVRDLKRFQQSGQTGFLRDWREGTQAAADAATVLPSAALVTRLADMPGEMDKTGAYLLGRTLVAEAENLRRQYKDVWRGRPRTRFHDVAARRSRELARGKGKRPGPKFGL